MEYVSGGSIPAPKGHYSPAVVHGGLVYVAGQLPADPGGRDMTKSPIEEQVRQTLANIATILDAGGSSLDRILRATVYITDVASWPRVNTAYAEVMGEHRPARTVVPVPELHYGYLVEIDVIAALRDS
jgi:2-iminobutanoate/2-iminopropanoate deaminase